MLRLMSERIMCRGKSTATPLSKSSDIVRSNVCGRFCEQRSSMRISNFGGFTSPASLGASPVILTSIFSRTVSHVSGELEVNGCLSTPLVKSGSGIGCFSK